MAPTWFFAPTGPRHARGFASIPTVMGFSTRAYYAVIDAIAATVLPILFLIAWFNGAF